NRACRSPAPDSSSHEFATSAIRRRCVDMTQVMMYLACFPSTAHEMAPPSLCIGVGRVDLGGCPPRSPSDPGLHITRTRFLTYDFAALRNRLWTTCGLGRPYRCSSRRKSDQGISPSRR